MPSYLRMTSAGLSEDGDEIVLRGVIDPDTFEALRADAYQREVQPIEGLRKIAKGFANSSVPDVDLGMRGGDYVEKDGTFTLRDPVYVVDGLQRISAARIVKQEGGSPVLGAALRFNTTFEFERERFEILNIRRMKMSPNVILRNRKDDVPFLGVLYDLSTTEEGFPVKGRVSWRQSMGREHLITATVLAKAIVALHGHYGSVGSSNIKDVIGTGTVTYDRVGKARFRANVMSFFGVLEDCWGVQSVVYKAPCAAIKSGFLMALARALSEHSDFWIEKQLVVPKDVREKLRTFPMSDPSVVVLLSGGSGAGRLVLRNLIVDHINSGRRTRRLKAWTDEQLTAQGKSGRGSNLQKKVVA